MTPDFDPTMVDWNNPDVEYMMKHFKMATANRDDEGSFELMGPGCFFSIRMNGAFQPGTASEQAKPLSPLGLPNGLMKMIKTSPFSNAGG